MPSLFNGYLIIDWSANSTPKTGKDSIWWCHIAWDEGVPVIIDVQNPATRKQALQQIKDILLHYKDTGQRLLVGFDFAYGYPAGFAHAIALGASPPWLAVWRYLYEHVQDSLHNANNRFEVAASMNQMLSGGAAPFWGCPRQKSNNLLSMCQPRGGPANLFKEFRLAEQGNNTHSVWKLSYSGAVGSQVLMGLPYVYALRTDPELEAISRVWPFDTGLKQLQQDDMQGPCIIHAEIYPSLIKTTATVDEVKDKLQVVGLAGYFAGLDQKQRLGELFAGHRPVTDRERQIIEREEGWILGL